MLPVWVR